MDTKENTNQKEDTSLPSESQCIWCERKIKMDYEWCDSCEWDMNDNEKYPWFRSHFE
jgi:hypothetical protein